MGNQYPDLEEEEGRVTKQQDKKELDNPLQKERMQCEPLLNCLCLQSLLPDADLSLVHGCVAAPGLAASVKGCTSDGDGGLLCGTLLGPDTRTLDCCGFCGLKSGGTLVHVAEQGGRQQGLTCRQSPGLLVSSLSS